MNVQTGRFKDGVIVVDNPEDFEEGETVAIVSRTDDGSFELTPAEEALLSESIAQANRGELISNDELRARLKRQD